jgi:hypothetical protein
MLRTKLYVSVYLLLICFAASVSAQQAASAAANAVVPQVIKFGGVLYDVNNKPVSGTLGVTFSLYKESQGGAALWFETQNVTPDKTGHYTVILGSTTSQGLPTEVFANGEARWLGLQLQGEPEKPRTLLMSVPYALKALDAETIGGKPASSFMLTPQAGGKSLAPGKLPAGTITGSGTTDFIPRWTGSTTIGNSNIVETAGGNVGIATATPAAKLDVKGTEDVRNTLTLFPSGTHPALSVHSTAFEVSSSGLVTFVSGQTFPGTGTITGVTAGAGLGGGGLSGNVTLNNTGLLGLSAGTGIAVVGGQNPTVSVSGVPLLAANNVFSASNTFLGAVDFSGGSTFGGAVGIGTSNPTSLLTVSGGTNDGQVEILGPSSSEASMGFRPSNVGKGTHGDWVIGTNTATSGAGGFSIEEPDQAAPYLVISPTDNVGIGTSGPWPGISMVGGLAINGGGSTVLLAQYKGTNSFAVNPDPVSTGNAWTLWDFAAGSWAPGITQNAGLVGIGTYTPDDNLTVNGSADKPGGGSWGTYSDRRLKTLDGAFSSGLSQILKINPVRYRYKEDNAMGILDTSEHIGLVAQEVKKVIPEAVTENSKGYLLVNNDPIIWTMLNAIKEQQRLIHQQWHQLQVQQARIATQEATFKVQEARLKKLAAQMSSMQNTLTAVSGKISLLPRSDNVELAMTRP